MEALITFGYNALAGVAGNIIYDLLSEFTSDKKVKKLVEYKESDDFENFKIEMQDILESNKKLKTELENLENQKSVTQNNVNGHNINANGNVNINYNYGNRENDPKH